MGMWKKILSMMRHKASSGGAVLLKQTEWPWAPLAMMVGCGVRQPWRGMTNGSWKPSKYGLMLRDYLANATFFGCLAGNVSSRVFCHARYGVPFEKREYFCFGFFNF